MWLPRECNFRCWMSASLHFMNWKPEHTSICDFKCAVVLWILKTVTGGLEVVDRVLSGILLGLKLNPPTGPSWVKKVNISFCETRQILFFSSEVRKTPSAEEQKSNIQSANKWLSRLVWKQYQLWNEKIQNTSENDLSVRVCVCVHAHGARRQNWEPLAGVGHQELGIAIFFCFFFFLRCWILAQQCLFLN